MIIHLKTVCPEIIGRIPNGEYIVRDGATAQQALYHCLESKGMNIPGAEQLSNLLYVVNHHQEKPDIVLNDGDRLMVLRPVRGG
ncbi:MAG: hypothetical protein Q4B55_00010 [Lachnospiraceae bacterium]|nr:hypothetical protein [Lachnospiraceae bacterium]